MKTTLRVPMMEQEQLQELLRILEDRGMETEKRQVMDLAQYLDGMDEQLGTVLEELKEVKEQLGAIRESGRSPGSHQSRGQASGSQGTGTGTERKVSGRG
ncbi:hypothetical protein K420107F6_32870 [Lactonifactor longoviformis]